MLVLKNLLLEITVLYIHCQCIHLHTHIPTDIYMSMQLSNTNFVCMHNAICHWTTLFSSQIQKKNVYHAKMIAVVGWQVPKILNGIEFPPVIVQLKSLSNILILTFYMYRNTTIVNSHLFNCFSL